jgi:hypothetical protein
VKNVFFLIYSLFANHLRKLCRNLAFIRRRSDLLNEVQEFAKEITNEEPFNKQSRLVN